MEVATATDNEVSEYLEKAISLMQVASKLCEDDCARISIITSMCAAAEALDYLSDDHEKS